MDIDFPLTLPAWLLIAVCAVMVAAAHAAFCGRSRDANKQATGNHSSIVASARRSAVLCAATAATTPTNIWATRPPLQTGPGDTRLTANDKIPASILLNLSPTRGPPGSGSNFLSVPTPPLCAASRASPFAVEPAAQENHT